MGRFVLEKNNVKEAGPGTWRRISGLCGIQNQEEPSADKFPMALADGFTIRIYKEVRGPVLKYQELSTLSEDVVNGEWVASYTAEDIPLEQAQALALEELASIRWNMQVRGVKHSDGYTYHTDEGGRSSIDQTLLLGARYEARAGEGTWLYQSWKTVNGYRTSPLTLLELEEVGFTVAAFIGGHFDREKKVIETIMAKDMTVTKLRGINLNTGWPETGF